MSRKVKKWLKGYPSAGRLVKMDFVRCLFLYMEVGDEQKSEEMAKKLSQCYYVSEDGLGYLLSFPTWRWEMSRKVKK